MVNKASDYSNSGRAFKILKWPRSACNWLFARSATMLLRNLMNYQDWHWWWVAWCQPNEARSYGEKWRGMHSIKERRRVNTFLFVFYVLIVEEERAWCNVKPCIETSSWNDDITAELESPLREKSVSRLARWDSKRQWRNRLSPSIFFFFLFSSTRSLHQRGNKNIWNSILHRIDLESNYFKNIYRVKMENNDRNIVKIKRFNLYFRNLDGFCLRNGSLLL